MQQMVLHRRPGVPQPAVPPRSGFGRAPPSATAALRHDSVTGA
ncbi:MAG TPA: hypothetical protein VHR45_24810 [Thermoanaerobaculia bacterium]|nr:hypothetical protein [Thermoanaerobaculia bacterium]